MLVERQPDRSPRWQAWNTIVSDKQEVSNTTLHKNSSNSKDNDGTDAEQAALCAAAGGSTIDVSVTLL
jgi:hypothetical protein